MEIWYLMVVESLNEILRRMPLSNGGGMPQFQLVSRE